MFCSLSSSSSGNSYIVGNGKDFIIIDAGISGKKIIEGLETLKIDKENIKGILITHEHTDHIKSVGVISKKLPNVKVYANKGTWDFIEEKVPPNKRETFNTGETFLIENLKITSFAISHDAIEPVAFSISYGNKNVTVLTDTGKVSEEMFCHLIQSDILVIEANYEERLLTMCRYPWKIKQRIASDLGHLSNEETAEQLCKILENSQKERQVLLAHLSSENNFPELAYRTIKNIIDDKNLNIRKNMKIDVIMKNKISKKYIV